MPDLYLQIEDSDAMLEGSSEYCEESALAILESGEIIGQKMIPWGSNYSFAAAVQTEAGDETLAIYKPASGENPLWDFPDGTLYKREVASYRLVRLLGWPMIPPTVIHNGPLGPGSLQLYRHPMEPDPVTDSSDFWGTPHPAIEQMVLFDHIANNADRKLSHCLRDRSGRPWGIDHGLTFNVDFKLRTVLWQYVGHPISEQLLVDLARVRADEATLRTELEPLLNENEIIVLLQRMDEFLRERRFPILNPGRNVPYGWW